VSRCLTEEACQRVPPRGVRSRMLQRPFRGGGLYIGDEADEAVVAALRRGAIQQVTLDDAFIGEAPHAAAEALDGPGCGVARGAIENAHHVAPGLVRAHLADDRQPLVQPRQEPRQMAGIAACPQLGDRLRIPRPEARIAADAAARPRRGKTRFGALGDQRALELRHRAQHLQREHALRRRGIDGVAQAAEMRTGGLQLFDDGEQMGDRPGKTVEPHDDQRLPGPDVAQEARQHRAAAIGAGGMLLDDHVAAGGAQLVALRIGALILGGDAGIADEARGGASARHPR
jgi:hypothetical protein